MQIKEQLTEISGLMRDALAISYDANNKRQTFYQVEEAAKNTSYGDKQKLINQAKSHRKEEMKIRLEAVCLWEQLETMFYELEENGIAVQHIQEYKDLKDAHARYYTYDCQGMALAHGMFSEKEGSTYHRDKAIRYYEKCLPFKENISPENFQKLVHELEKLKSITKQTDSSQSATLRYKPYSCSKGKITFFKYQKESISISTEGDYSEKGIMDFINEVKLNSARTK